MVGRTTVLWMLLVFALAGCDPFAPEEPETPTSVLDLPLAESAKDVPRIWGLALSARSPTRLNAVTSEQLVVARAGKILSSSGLTNCVVDRLFNSDSLVAPRWASSWTQESSVSDTVRADIDYEVSKGEGPRLAHGVALWTMIRVNPSEWRLWRWEDDASSDSSLFAFCQGPVR